LPDDIPAPLRAIIAKALAGDINHRYHSADEFERDLRAFVERRTPAASGQKVSWEANATLQKNGATQVVRPPSNPTRLTSRPISVPLKSAAPRKRRIVVSTLAIAHLTGILLPDLKYHRTFAKQARLRA
jgi:hypothetical protein